ncbi:hypothetical protein B0H13DRAFT_2289780 [Mycena leptocephala]|nr:hypothetical protein B0H13DRAFT_2289780 [Mycena leptocephala]
MRPAFESTNAGPSAAGSRGGPELAFRGDVREGGGKGYVEGEAAAFAEGGVLICWDISVGFRSLGGGGNASSLDQVEFSNLKNPPVPSLSEVVRTCQPELMHVHSTALNNQQRAPSDLPLLLERFAWTPYRHQKILNATLCDRYWVYKPQDVSDSCPIFESYCHVVFPFYSPLLAPIARSSPSRPASISPALKRGFSDVTYQGLGPRPWGTLDFDARSPQAKKAQWFRYVDGGIGVGVSPGTQVGWRLTDDPQSEIVFYMANDPRFLTANYNGSDANTPTIQSFANLGEATFPAPSNDTTTRSVDRSIHSIWQNSTGGAVVPWQYSLAITNGCSDGRIIVITTVDANGTAQTISGPDDRVMTFPSLPMNVTVYFEDSPNDVTSISYFVVDALTYKVGAGSNRRRTDGASSNLGRFDILPLSTLNPPSPGTGTLYHYGSYIAIN